MKFTRDQKDKLLRDFNRRITKSADQREMWLQKEVIDNYSVVENGGKFGQWDEKDWQYQDKGDMPTTEVNRVNPVIRAISGFQIQNRLEITYTPRKRGNAASGFADMAQKGYRYLHKSSNAKYENSRAFKDMLICGEGYVHPRISYDNNLNGELELCRVFPGFVFRDPSARAKNMSDANWISVVSVRDKVAEGYDGDEYDDEDEGEESYSSSDSNSTSSDEQVLRFFNYSDAGDTELVVEHDYQWRQKEDVYRIKNPVLDAESNPRQDLLMLPDIIAATTGIPLEGNPVMDYFDTAVREFGIDPEDSIWFFEKSDWLKFRKAIKGHNELLAQFGMNPIALDKPLKQKRYVYYRATICKGAIKDLSRNISQEQFATRVMTGEFSESDQMYMGLVRFMKSPQRLLNQTISDFQTYIRCNPRGGVILEADAVDDVEAFAETYLLGQDVTFVKPGTISGTKIMAKPTSPLAQGVIELIAYCGDAIMQAAGVTPEFMGQMQSKDMTGVLQGQIIRQTLTVLSEYLDSYHQFIHDQARLFIDCLRVLAENDDGRLLPDLVGGENAQYFELMYDELAAEYDVEVSETPQLPNERQTMHDRLWDMQLKLMQSGRGENIMPLILEFSDIPSDKKKALEEALKPPPPPEPDPVQQNLIIAQTEDLFASAREKNIRSAKLELELNTRPQESLAGLGKTQADTELTKAKTLSELSKIGASNGRTEQRV